MTDIVLSMEVKSMRSIVFSVFFTTLIAGSVLGQGAGAAGIRTSTADKEKAAILKLEDDNSNARLRGDAANLRKLYADDFVGINASGGKTDKANIVDFYSKDGPVLAINSTDDVLVRVMGTAAMVSARLKYQYNSTMENQTVRWLRYSRIYEKRSLGWVVVAEHFSFTDSPEAESIQKH